MLEKTILLNIKPKSNKVLIIMITSALILFIIICTIIKTYTVTNTVGYIECNEECFINLHLTSNNIDKINNKTILEIDNKKYEVSEINYNDIFIENNIPYQNITIKTDLNEEKIVNIKLLNNKQRVIKKLYKVIKEG